MSYALRRLAATLPVMAVVAIVVFLLMQRFFVRGLTAGAVKG